VKWEKYNSPAPYQLWFARHDLTPVKREHTARPAPAVIARTPYTLDGWAGGWLSEDPVRLGLVASIPRPGGNATGINFLSGELGAKRLELLHELLPGAVRIAVLNNPSDAASAETTVREVEAGARAMGLQLLILNASSSNEIHAAFATIARERPDALFLGSDSLWTSRRVQLATLAVRHAIPMACQAREVVKAGGLMSYGANIEDTFRQAGVYAGRILKGAKPADLPVVQSSRFELVINADTARTLGLTVPPTRGQSPRDCIAMRGIPDWSRTRVARRKTAGRKTG
jgi:putative ABC transport system substrate-binding protein